MASSSNLDAFPHSGIVDPDAVESGDTLGELSYAITHDVLYGILHDLMLETHREAKMERAASAAVIVKQKAMQEYPHLANEISAGSSQAKIETHTAGAVYKDGIIYLDGNPFKTTSDIICPKCGLPRLLHPTTGKGAKTPEAGIEYCKKRPFIDKDYYDVHGQTFVPKGPGRGRKREDVFDPVMQQVKAGTPNGSQDSAASPPPTQLKEPHAKCINCGSFQAASRMNKHMSKCIGGLSRESARNAKTKISNGNDAGSQNGYSPPGSRNSTPAIGHGSKGSPGKRSAEDELDESDESPKKKKKKFMKKTPLTKLKAHPIKKSGSQISASNLSFENRILDNDYDDGDDARDSSYGTKTTKSKAAKSNMKIDIGKAKSKMMKKVVVKHKKNIAHESSGEAAERAASSIEVSNGRSRHTNGATPSTEESSQTMSSPNPE